MATLKAVKAAAKELNKAMGLEPPIEGGKTAKSWLEAIRENIEGQLEEGDEFKDSTVAILEEAGVDVSPLKGEEESEAEDEEEETAEDDEEDEEAEDKEDDEEEDEEDEDD